MNKLEMMIAKTRTIAVDGIDIRYWLCSAIKMHSLLVDCFAFEFKCKIFGSYLASLEVFPPEIISGLRKTIVPFHL